MKVICRLNDARQAKQREKKESGGRDRKDKGSYKNRELTFAFDHAATKVLVTPMEMFCEWMISLNQTTAATTAVTLK